MHKTQINTLSSASDSAMAWWHDVCSLTRVISLPIWRSNWCRCSYSCVELVTTSVMLSTYTHRQQWT